jgi:23S rRNA maturation-related 3'-5' exoribonuclease YhaM
LINLKDRIIELLRSTKREGIENLIKHMDDIGFFTAPCSSQYHLCKVGGLAEHSLNVYTLGYEELYSFLCMYNDLTTVNWTIVSLLHDLGKCGQYGKENYISNMISDKKGGYVQSDKKPFETNKDLLPVPHEIRSIHIASQFIELTEQESFAILHHNGMYGDLKYQLQGKETPLQQLLHFSDMYCSRFIEKEGE